MGDKARGNGGCKQYQGPGFKPRFGARPMEPPRRKKAKRVLVCASPALLQRRWSVIKVTLSRLGEDFRAGCKLRQEGKGACDPRRLNTLSQAACAMRACVELCTRLDNQRDVVED